MKRTRISDSFSHEQQPSLFESLKTATTESEELMSSIRDSKLAKLAGEFKAIAERKRLDVKLTWIPRKENLAGKLL